METNIDQLVEVCKRVDYLYQFPNIPDRETVKNAIIIENFSRILAKENAQELAKTLGITEKQYKKYIIDVYTEIVDKTLISNNKTMLEAILAETKESGNYSFLEIFLDRLQSFNNNSDRQRKRSII